MASKTPLVADSRTPSGKSSAARPSRTSLSVLLAITAALLLPCAATAENEPAIEDYIRVEVRGKVQSGVAAIGGETTGTTITAKNVTWELDVGTNAAQRLELQRLDGQQVVVRGTLEMRAGVEIPARWIVHVRSIDTPGSERFAIQIDRTGNIHVGGKRVDPDQLADLLTELSKNMKKQDGVLIRVDRDCRVEHIERVLEACEKAGVRNFRLFTAGS